MVSLRMLKTGMFQSRFRGQRQKRSDLMSSSLASGVTQKEGVAFFKQCNVLTDIIVGRTRKYGDACETEERFFARLYSGLSQTKTDIVDMCVQESF